GRRTGYVERKNVRLSVGPAPASVTKQVQSQGKPIIVVQPFTVATGVELPYDVTQLHPQLIADLKVQIGKEFDVVGELPVAPQGSVHRLGGEIRGWRPGNAAKRLVIGLGSGR